MPQRFIQLEGQRPAHPCEGQVDCPAVDKNCPSRLLFDEIAESCPAGIVVINKSGKIIYTNHRAQQMIGLTRTEYGDRQYNESAWKVTDFKGNPTPESELIFSRVLTSGRAIYDVQHAVERNDGSRVYLCISGEPVMDGKESIKYVVFTMMDVSSSVEAERALQASERRFSSALENAPIGMAIVSLDGHFVLVNQALCLITGYSKPELELKNFQAITHPEDLEADLSLLRDLVAGKIPSYQMEKRYIRGSGEVVWILLSVSLIRDETGTPLHFISQMQDITEQRLREDQIHYIAQHDALTALPNRVLFQERAGQALKHAHEHSQQLALMMVDLDHFKRINDSLGHDVGDTLLQVVAQRIQSCLGMEDTVARMGGDEFVVLLPRLPSLQVATQIASNIVEVMSLPISISGHDLVVSTSIGIAIYPDHGSTVSTLVKNADTAMYKAKNAGRSDYRLFSRDMAEVAAKQLAIEAAIRQGLRNNEFKLHYQPQVCITSGKIVGMEALLRWSRNGKMIPPTTFIPVAEQAGLMQTLGEWVLQTALRETRELSERIGSPIKLAVNLSPQQIQNPYFKDKLLRLMAEARFDPTQLEIEITEGILISDLDQVHQTLSDIRRQGVSVALDDFGTGYSSLSYLARFPINTLKIDRSFMLKLMENTSDRAVVTAIMAMAQSLKMKVIAEGVETPAQLAFLQSRDQIYDHGKRQSDRNDNVFVQGYHFSHALDLESLIAHFEDIGRLSKDRVEHTPAPLQPDEQCVMFQ